MLISSDLLVAELLLCRPLLSEEYKDALQELEPLQENDAALPLGVMR